MPNYNHFYELPVYAECRAFRKKVAALIKEKFPKSENFMLASQLLRSSRSITANIAEGFGRFHYQENIQFCRIARGSLSESKEHVITAMDEDYLDQKIVSELDNEYKNCLKQLNAYINFLKKAKSQ